MDLQTAQDIGQLDPQAIAQVREDAWPRDRKRRRTARCAGGARLPHRRRSAVPGVRRRARAAAPCHAPAGEHGGALLRRGGAPARVAGGVPATQHCRRRSAPVSAGRPALEEALREILRGRLDLLGPVTAAALGAPLGMSADAVLPALLQLEVEGAVMRGAFTAAGARRMVRPAPARAHPPLHARQAARRDPAGAAGAVHALPVPLAPAGRQRWRRAPRRRRRTGRRAAPARRPCGAGSGLGRGPARGARQGLHAGHAGQALRRGPRGVVADRPRQGDAARRKTRADPRHAGAAVRARRPGALAAGGWRRRWTTTRAVRQGAPGAARRCARTARASSPTCSTTPGCWARRSSRRWPNWWRTAWSPAIRSPACARW